MKSKLFWMAVGGTLILIGSLSLLGQFSIIFLPLKLILAVGSILLGIRIVISAIRRK